MHTATCSCTLKHHQPKLVVLTGGPGGGKTAVLEIAQRHFCGHVIVLPEAAGILFKGGFPRKDSEHGRRAAQTAIFHTQLALENLALAEQAAAMVLCDRGTLDALAYWPPPQASFFEVMNTAAEALLARYAAVIHLRTPSLAEGYNHRNALRVETAEQAMALDERILDAWAGHKRRTIINNSPNFLDKATQALDAIRRELPACCAHTLR